MAHLPAHDYYAEPFAGAASILLSKPVAKGGEIINDLNQDVVNLFRVLQDRTSYALLVERLRWTPYATAEFERARQPSSDPVERACRMVIRSFMGIEVSGVKGSASGFRMGNVDLRRLDREGKATFRNCARDWANWQAALDSIRERLSEVMIYERDALEFIDLMDSPNCLLYVDPPYHPATRSGPRYAVDMTAEQHLVLVHRLAQCAAKVVLSGYRHADHSILESAGWRRVDRDYRANMSLRPRVESLWLSPSV